MPLTVKANAIDRRECLGEVPFEFFWRAASEPARACASGQFLVDPAVIPGRVIGRED
jgi:hypothetical protein